jgi:hypothetical protein
MYLWDDPGHHTTLMLGILITFGRLPVLQFAGAFIPGVSSIYLFCWFWIVTFYSERPLINSCTIGFPFSFFVLFEGELSAGMRAWGQMRKRDTRRQLQLSRDMEIYLVELNQEIKTLQNFPTENFKHVQSLYRLPVFFLCQITKVYAFSFSGHPQFKELVWLHTTALLQLSADYLTAKVNDPYMVAHKINLAYVVALLSKRQYHAVKRPLSHVYVMYAGSSASKGGRGAQVTFLLPIHPA